jgi:predicted O-methyltransferase YrrM
MNDVISFVETHLKKIKGWCSVDKAIKLINCIDEIKPDICIEIGVFGGSSFIPQALALKHLGKGKIFGIDPWDVGCTLEEMKGEKDREWWSGVGIESIYRHFMDNVNLLGVKDFCEIIRDKAENVHTKFEDESVGILHIDGNHSESLAYKDATLYLPKLKIGGYIFFDDIDWKEEGSYLTTKKAVNYLLDYCDKQDVINGNCLIMKKTKSMK